MIQNSSGNEGCSLSPYILEELSRQKPTRTCCTMLMRIQGASAFLDPRKGPASESRSSEKDQEFHHPRLHHMWVKQIY